MIAGVDGCRGGWVAVIESIDGSLHVEVVTSLQQLLEDRDLTTVVVDVPIGLPDRGARSCDREARRLLGRTRGSSVFPAPLRGMLEATSHAKASAMRREIEGKGWSIQGFGILPKIREVDTLLRREPSLQEKIIEGHPEVSFAYLSGAPLLPPKRSRAGRDLRRRLLEPAFPDLPRWLLRPDLRKIEDDVLDAFACLWTARRVRAGESVTIGDGESDSCGIRVSITA